MSEYLKHRVIEKVDNIVSIITNDISYDDNLILTCKKHGNYNKTVKQILYKNPNCPECTRIAKSKKLSDIGKTKTGVNNNFYGRHHTAETKLKLSKAWDKNADERKRKISETVKSDECQKKLRQTKLEKYGSATYVNSKQMRKTKLADIARYENENQVTNVLELVKLYKGGWINAGIVNIIKYKGVCFISNKDIPKIINYSKSITPKSGMSHKEKDIVDFIKTFYSGEILENSRSIIYPKELDIYLPELKLAIEFNGNYWHSVENGCDKSFHLMKSLLCKNKNVRLIHIYEFENLEEQKQLLKNLILGVDNYPKNDFNKNNFIDIIPELYENNTEKGTVYSIGPLIKEEII